MPEAYTHIRIARAALDADDTTVAEAHAYELGANGPDAFFVYVGVGKQNQYPLRTLGSRIHKEKCGLFLQALAYYARTPAQRSYAMGFLAHYAADSVLHPYVAACTRAGAPFAGVGGHGFCEVAMDTMFHAADTGKSGVPADDAAPVLTPAVLAEVCILLRRTVSAVFEIEIPVTAYADTFHIFRFLHRFCYSPYGGKKIIGWLVDRTAAHGTNYAVSHMTPRKMPKAGFPAQWVNPFTEETVEEDPNALCARATALCREYHLAVLQYWQEKLSPAQLAHLLGNRSYETGLPVCKAQETV